MSCSNGSTNNNEFQSALKRGADNIQSAFKKKFKENNGSCSNSLTILQQLKASSSNKVKSSPTLLRQMQASAKYEARFFSRLEENGDAFKENSDPYSKENFTLGGKCCHCF